MLVSLVARMAREDLLVLVTTYSPLRCASVTLTRWDLALQELKARRFRTRQRPPFPMLAVSQAASPDTATIFRYLTRALSLPRLRRIQQVPAQRSIASSVF